MTQELQFPASTVNNNDMSNGGHDSASGRRKHAIFAHVHFSSHKNGCCSYVLKPQHDTAQAAQPN